MTKEQLDAIPRRSAKEILADTNGNGGEAVMAAALNEEWWRGYHVGRDVKASRTKLKKSKT